MPRNNPLDYDPHEPCRRAIQVLERQLWKHDYPEIAMVTQQEYLHGILCDRVLQVLDVTRTPNGLEIRCR